MNNPRYGYVTLPLLCPLAGAVAESMRHAPFPNATRLRQVAIGCVVLFFGATLAVTIATIKVPGAAVSTVACTITSAAIGGWAATQLWRARNPAVARGAWAAAWGLVAMILLLSVPLGIQKNESRASKSGVEAARKLRSLIGPGTRIDVGAALRYEPEIFWYAKADAHGYLPEEFGPSRCRSGRGSS